MKTVEELRPNSNVPICTVATRCDLENVKSSIPEFNIAEFQSKCNVICEHKFFGSNTTLRFYTDCLKNILSDFGLTEPSVFDRILGSSLNENRVRISMAVCGIAVVLLYGKCRK